MSDTTPTDRSDLVALGFTDRERALFASLEMNGFVPARVVRVDRGMPLVATAEGVVRAEPATHLVKSASDEASRAVVGDWVALTHPEGHDMPIIEAILPRKSAFTRQDPGEETGAQVLISNIDTVFVVQSLSGDGINVRRLERELVVAWDSGAVPVVVLTKADLCDDVDAQRTIAEDVSHGVDVIVESAITGLGLDDVQAHVPAGSTAALLGGSGVGKSTLINRLLGDELIETQEVRVSDDKGRHTTIARELWLLPDAGAIIDTPGMRALALWDAGEGLGAAFPDIEELAQRCRFRDCVHESEPGCAVLAAVESGELPARRLESYRRLTIEMEALQRRRDEKAWRESEQAKKLISKAAKGFFKDHPKEKRR